MKEQQKQKIINLLKNIILIIIIIELLRVTQMLLLEVQQLKE